MKMPTRKLWMRLLCAGFLACSLAVGPVVHAYLHPHEVHQNSTCPSTGFTLSIGSNAHHIPLPGSPGKGRPHPIPRRAARRLIHEFALNVTRGPPAALPA